MLELIRDYYRYQQFATARILDAAARAPFDQLCVGVLPGFETSVAAYATDIPKLGNWGTPYLFGPGSIHVAHRDDEYVAIPELRAAVDHYVAIARQALATAPA